MDQYGFFLLSRKMFRGGDPFWDEEREFSRAEAWIDCIEMAAFKAHKKVKGNQVVNLRRGEFLGSLRYLAKRWSWHKDRVGRYLSVLHDMDRIETARETPHGTVYRLVNYRVYQDRRTPKRDSNQDGTRDESKTGVRQECDKEKQGEVRETREFKNPREASGPQPEPEGDTNVDPMADRGRDAGRDLRLDVRGAGGDDPIEVLRRCDDEWDKYRGLLACWADANYENRPPPTATIDAQADPAWRLVRQHDGESLARMAFGIGLLFPHSDGEPWSLATLERKQAEALSAAEKGGARKKSKSERNLEAIMGVELE